MTDMRDEMLDQIVEELRTLPRVDDVAVGRIVRAAAANAELVRAAEADVRRPWSVVRSGWWQSRIPLAAAAGLALVAGLAGYAIRGGDSRTPTAAAVRTPAELRTVASAQVPSRAADLAAVPTQFVLDAPGASRVSLVGDFNAWDAGASQLARVGPRGIWTITVPLPPGRHTYAFMVDDNAWTLDPRAPTAQDPDFGTPSSVVLVGTP